MLAFIEKLEDELKTIFRQKEEAVANINMIMGIERGLQHALQKAKEALSLGINNPADIPATEQEVPAALVHTDEGVHVQLEQVDAPSAPAPEVAPEAPVVETETPAA